ncbi:MAG: hypothetical protein QXO71_08025 [Candidatus Jordarchaeaceae archaeon]
MSKEVSSEIRKERERNVRKVIRNFLVDNIDEALKGLAAISDLDVRPIYEEMDRIVRAHKGHDSINMLPVIVNCPRCIKDFFLDSDIEEEFVEGEGSIFGSFACPNCNALTRYDFIEKKIVSSTGRNLPDNTFLDFKVNMLRKRVEELLTPFFNEIIKFGESKHSVIAIPVGDKCRIVLRHAAKKRSEEEKWETKWHGRFKVEISNTNVCTLNGEIKFDSERDSKIGSMTFSKSLKLEKSHILPKGDLELFANALANILSEASKEAILSILGLLEEAPLVLEWMRPLKRLAAFEPSGEAIPFVSELEKKIKERKEKKEREPERI